MRTISRAKAQREFEIRIRNSNFPCAFARDIFPRIRRFLVQNLLVDLFLLSERDAVIQKERIVFSADVANAVAGIEGAALCYDN